MNKLFVLFAAVIFSVFCASCGEPDEPEEYVVPDDFEISARWEFVRVAGEGVIFGVPQMDVDESPEGYVEFYDFGQGLSDISLTLLNRDLVKEEENLDWFWVDNNTVDIEEEDGAREIWNILSTTDNTMTAEWDIMIAGNTATITADLIKIE